MLQHGITHCWRATQKRQLFTCSPHKTKKAPCFKPFYKKWRLRQRFACRSRVLAASGFRATCLHMRQATATKHADCIMSHWIPRRLDVPVWLCVSKKKEYQKHSRTDLLACLDMTEVDVILYTSMDISDLLQLIDIPPPPHHSTPSGTSFVPGRSPAQIAACTPQFIYCKPCFGATGFIGISHTQRCCFS